MHAINNSTPETDKQEAMDNGDTAPLLDFARNLERERDEARAALSGRTVSCSHCDQVAVERDEARERERVAIASWDEERQRALREGERVVEARELARELLDALTQKGKSVGLSLVDHALLAKAKEVLP